MQKSFYSALPVTKGDLQVMQQGHVAMLSMIRVQPKLFVGRQTASLYTVEN